MSQLYGVDVSEFQEEINWDQLNAVANFVIIRSSFGTARKDNQFNTNQAEARRVRDQAGPLGIGYYYFAYPTLVDAVTSADFFVNNLGELQENEVLALDLEGDIGPNPVGWALQFFQHVESRTGTKPLIYLNQSEVRSYDWSPVIRNGNGLWIADYDGNKTGPGVETPWPVVAIRQWTDADNVAGIAGHVDGDVFYGDINAWYAYGVHKNPVAVSAPAPSATPPPEPVETVSQTEVTPPVLTTSTATPTNQVKDASLPHPTTHESVWSRLWRAIKSFFGVE